MYIIKNKKGYYYRNMGAYETKGTCWTRSIWRAAKYRTYEDAENNSCIENEYVAAISDECY